MALCPSYANRPLYEVVPPPGWGVLMVTESDKSVEHTMLCPMHVAAVRAALPPPSAQGVETKETHDDAAH